MYINTFYFLDMPRTEEEILHLKKQAQWFRVCSLTHSQFCNCGDWIYHLRKYLWPTGTTSTDSLHTTGGGHIVDRFIIAGGGDGFIGKDGGPELHSTELLNKG